MDTVPKRSKIAQFYRVPLAKLEGSLPLVIKDPNIYSVLGLVLSVGFFFVTNPMYQIILLIVILLSDWLDGATARRYKLTSKNGYLVDVTVDRLSEGLIFIALLDSTVGKIFFTGYILNNLLAFYSLKTGKHTSLALRFFFLVYLIIVTIF